MRGVSRTSLAAVSDQVESSSAKPSAKALRELAGELFGVVHFLAGQARLRRVVSDPAAGADQRSELISGLLGEHVSKAAAEIVDALVRSSWSQPRDLVDALDEIAAQVLFAAEDKDKALDDIEDELFRFTRLLEREPQLRSALTDPGLPTDRKESLLEALLEGKVRDATLSMVREVVLHPRGRTIDRGLDEYARMAAARRERLVAHVRTVVELTKTQQAKLSAALAAEVGHDVHLNIEVDPTLIGGLSVRIGDELFDGSIAHRLSTARRLMTR